jgi:hypothetical protein
MDEMCHRKCALRRSRISTTVLYDFVAVRYFLKFLSFKLVSSLWVSCASTGSVCAHQ